MHTEPYSQFMELLTEEKQLVDTLHSTLEAEREALTVRDAVALERLASEKGEAFSRLEQLGELHLSLVSAAGFGGDKSGLEAFIAAAPTTMAPALNDVWHSLRETLRQCQTLNQINGQIVHSTLGETRASLSLLTRGCTPQADVYTPSGTTAANTDSRSYARV